MLHGQSYAISEGALWGMAEWWLARENQRNLQKNLPQFHFIHHECNMKSSGIEPRCP
jgi:hypothetical protein